MTVMSLDQALAIYGEDLVIAATGAIAKKGQGPDGEVRVIYDGSHGVLLNSGIKIRDQVRFPTAPDIKAVLAEVAEEVAPLGVGAASTGLRTDAKQVAVRDASQHKGDRGTSHLVGCVIVMLLSAPMQRPTS